MLQLGRLCWLRTALSGLFAEGVECSDPLVLIVEEA